MRLDLEIARAIKKLSVAKVACKLRISLSQLIPYGHEKTKIGYEIPDNLTAGHMVSRYLSPGSLAPNDDGKSINTIGDDGDLWASNTPVER